MTNKTERKYEYLHRDGPSQPSEISLDGYSIYILQNKLETMTNPLVAIHKKFKKWFEKDPILFFWGAIFVTFMVTFLVTFLLLYLPEPFPFAIISTIWMLLAFCYLVYWSFNVGAYVARTPETGMWSIFYILFSWPMISILGFLAQKHHIWPFNSKK